MIKAIFFDLDGTLINTNPRIIRTFKETFEMYLPERTFLEEEIYDCIGPTLEQTFYKYYPEKMNEMVQSYRHINKSYHDEMVVIYPGIIEMLQTLRARNFKLAIVTSKKRDMAIYGATTLGIYDYFDLVVSSDDVKAHKPEPDCIEAARTFFNFDKSEVMMIGDNSQDILCAKNAGVLSVGVSWTLRGADYLQKFNPDYMLKEAMDLVTLVTQLNEKE